MLFLRDTLALVLPETASIGTLKLPEKVCVPLKVYDPRSISSPASVKSWSWLKSIQAFTDS